MSESLALLAILASITGAGLATVRAYLESPESEKYSWKKLTGALIGAVLFSFTTVNLVNLPEQASATGIAGIFILNAVAGTGIATILHKSNK